MKLWLLEKRHTGIDEYVFSDMAVVQAETEENARNLLGDSWLNKEHTLCDEIGVLSEKLGDIMNISPKVILVAYYTG